MTKGRTLRQVRLREALYLAAAGRCQRCGEPLGDDWEADHIVPWSVSGHTNVFEMQALCKPCNRKKGAAMPSDQDTNVSPPRLSTLLAGAQWDAFRPGQQQALQIWMERVASEERFTSLVLPTRYGKSDVIRVGAYWSWKAGLVFTTLVMSPGKSLRDQMGEEWRFNEAWKRYGLSGQGVSFRNMQTTPQGVQLNYRAPVPNGEMLVSATIQFVQEHLDTIGDWVESVRRATGLPVQIVVDESHTGAEDREWGRLVNALVARGAVAVLLTATPFREDGRAIPGFEFETLGMGARFLRTTYKTAPDDQDRDNGYWLRQIWSAERRAIRLKANHETSFEEAWGERPSPLCTVNHVTFAADIKIERGDGIQINSLAELTISDATRALGKAVRDPSAIRHGITRMVERIRLRRAGRPELAAIVFCGSDRPDDDGANAHAKRIANEIERQAPDMEVVTATSTDEDGIGAKRLEAFKSGRGDILIVKFMAGVGQDIPRVKTILDLSPVRTMSSCIQRWMRAGTPYEGITTFDLILPDDVLQAAIFLEWVEGNGGKAANVDLDLLKEDLVKRQEYDEDPTWYGVGDIGNGRFDDNRGNRGEPDEHDASFALFRAIPFLSTQMTQAEVAKHLRANGLHVYVEEPDELVQSTSVEAGELYRKANLAADGVAKLLAGDFGSDPERWRHARSEAFAEAKRAAGVSPYMELRNIVDVADLKAIVASLEGQESRAVRR